MTRRGRRWKERSFLRRLHQSCFAKTYFMRNSRLSKDTISIQTPSLTPNHDSGPNQVMSIIPSLISKVSPLP